MSALTVEQIEEEIDKIDDAPIPASIKPAAAAMKKSDSPLALKEYIDVDQLKKDVEFDPNDLDTAVRQHAGLFIHYANIARLARRQWERMKAAVEILESRLGTYHREALTGAGGKVTEAMIEAATKSDPRWWAAQQKEIDARAIYDLANDAREAFSQRKDMIVQVSVDRRREKEGQLRIGTEESISEQRNRVLAGIGKAAK